LEIRIRTNDGQSRQDFFAEKRKPFSKIGRNCIDKIGCEGREAGLAAEDILKGQTGGKMNKEKGAVSGDCAKQKAEPNTVTE